MLRFVYVQLDRERRIAGIIPRLVFTDKSTYVESSTKIYDDVSRRKYDQMYFIIIILKRFPLCPSMNRWPSGTCHGCSTLYLAAMLSTVYCM